jgi:RimJ/RimL family protein N-acetyltransferase
MRRIFKKPSLLAWIVFCAIAALSIYNLVVLLAGSGNTQNIFQLASDICWAILPAEFAFLAALILSCQPRNVIGWLVMLPGTIDGKDEIEIAYLIDKTFCGQGLGTEAARGIRDYAFEKLGLTRLICLIYEHNRA